MAPPVASDNLGATLRPTQAQRWNILGGFVSAASNSRARREIAGWCGLSLLALALAGVFALLLALSRVPGINDIFPWPLQFFEKGLVIHVVFSFVVWFLGILGALLVIATFRTSNGKPRLIILGNVALIGATVAFVLLFVPGFFNRGAPSLNNYVPVIIDPLYYAGLIILAASLSLVVIRLLINIPACAGPLEPVSIGALAGGLIYLFALACFVIAWFALGDVGINGDYNESLFWGGGHILQFSNVALLLVGWYVLGGLAMQTPLVRPGLLTLAHAYLIAAGLLGIVFYLVEEPFSAAQTEAFTLLQYALPLPTVLIAGLGLSTTVRRIGGLPWRDPSFSCLALSILVFGIGGILGLFVDGADTRTPAHYHAVIGGINLAFIGIFLGFFLPIIGRVAPTGGAVTALIHLYAWGQVLASIGLFLAGGYGAPRKTAGDAQGLEEIGAIAGLYINGVGALIAVIGGVMFIWIAARALIENRDRKTIKPSHSQSVP